MKFSQIPQYTRDGNYSINVSWKYLEKWIDEHESEVGLNLNPDYQRAHVWSKNQQIAFVEFQLRGGVGSNILRYNCPGWMAGFEGPFELVDGKQRLEAVLKFMRNELKVFGYYLSEFEDNINIIRPDFIMTINDLPLRSQVLQWYLDINAGGVIHTEEELERVRKLLEIEKGKE
jgi:uncharacterized protein with ParB-like and HNH nuclease domain